MTCVDYQPLCKRVMSRCREAYMNTSLTLDDLGTRMGYPPASARKSAWQFLNNTTDPRLSMLLRFGEAVGCDVRDFFDQTWEASL